MSVAELVVEPCLYRRLTADSFVRYDPAADAYAVVPAERVPPLARVTPARVRMSVAINAGAKVAGVDPKAPRKRRAILMAMLQFQARAHKAGNAEAAAPYLEALAKLAADPQALAKLRLSWSAAQTRKGRVKAVGSGSDIGRTLYGARAEAALRAQDARGGRSGSEHREHVARSGEKAREILAKAQLEDLTADHLNELATHLPALPVERLRNARVLLNATWGGKRLRRDDMVKALTQHVRNLVDGTASIDQDLSRKGGTPPTRAKLADGTAVNFVHNPDARKGEYTTVAVDPKKLDAAWSQDAGFYVPPGGGGAEIAGRRERFEKFLAGGKAIHAPRVGLVGEKVTFDDGRHRFAVLRDRGIDRVAVTVPADQAEEVKKRFGAGEQVEGAKAGAEARPEAASGTPGPSAKTPAAEATPAPAEAVKAVPGPVFTHGTYHTDAHGRTRLLAAHDSAARAAKEHDWYASRALQNAPGMTVRQGDVSRAGGHKVFVAPLGTDGLPSLADAAAQARSDLDRWGVAHSHLDDGRVIGVRDNQAHMRAALGKPIQATVTSKSAPSTTPAGAVDSAAMSTPAPSPPPLPAPPTAPAAPTSPPDYAKWDRLLQTSGGDRVSAERIARGYGIPIRPAERPRPVPGTEGDLVRAAIADPAKWGELIEDAGKPEIDRNKLLAVVKAIYGDEVHAQASRKHKAGILELIRGQTPRPGNA